VNRRNGPKPTANQPFALGFQTVRSALLPRTDWLVSMSSVTYDGDVSIVPPFGYCRCVPGLDPIRT
jgi:hypothetical protein